MAEHTSGPWIWWTSCSWRRLRHSDRGKDVDVLMPTVLHDGQPDIVVSQADMHLIAAAPDLLEALKAVVGEWEEWPHLEPCDEVITKVHAAIAKAEGRS